MVSTHKIFNAYSLYYDLLYKDKDYASEVAYIQNILKQHKIFSGDILELGSGTGKHGRLLAKYGYKVHGIERSSEMASQALTNEGFSCQVGDICTINLKNKYDAVLSLFHVISYQIDNKSVHAVFERTSEHLRSGGLFIFDVWYSPAVLTQRPSIRIKRLTNGNSEIIRIAEPTVCPNTNTVDVNYTIIINETPHGTINKLFENHPMRHFSLPEIDFLCETHGFQRVRAEEFLTCATPSEETWGVCIILRKN